MSALSFVFAVSDSENSSKYGYFFEKSALIIHTRHKSRSFRVYYTSISSKAESLKIIGEDVKFKKLNVL